MNCLCPQNVQTVSTVRNVLRRVVLTVLVTDCVTRSQVIVSVDVTVATWETSVTLVSGKLMYFCSSDFLIIFGDFLNGNQEVAMVRMVLNGHPASYQPQRIMRRALCKMDAIIELSTTKND